MKMKIAALLLVIAPFVNAQVYDGHVYGQQNFGSWTGILVQRGSDARFRATAHAGNWNLYIDLIPPSCDIVMSALLDISANPIQQDIAAFDFMGGARVDQEDVWNIKFATSAAMGDTGIIFTAYSIPNSPELFKQMGSGRQMIMKFEVTPGNASYATFPLNGFYPALQYENAACTKASAPPEPRQKSPSSNKKKNPSGEDKFL